MAVVRSIDEASYQQRFTPRRPRSVWSRVNVARVEALRREGRMTAAGLAAYEARDRARTGVYSFEREVPELEPAQLARLQADARAWAHFSAQAPSYLKACRHWISSAKRPQTRASRPETLIECSSRGEPIPLLRRPQRAR